MERSRAVVFDMDGVIVDSEAQWKPLEREFLSAEVDGWSEEYHARLVGMGVEDVYAHLTREHGLHMDKADFLERSEKVARQVYLERVSLVEGFEAFLAELRARGTPTAIASSSPHRWISLVLERFKLASRFDAVVSSDDVGGRTKPQPDVYLEAAARLQLPPASCLAVEDSAIGLEAAKRAGLRAAALRTTHNLAQNLSRADLELNGFQHADCEGLGL